jgi:hypothetical protein
VVNTRFLIISPLFIHGRNANQHLADSFIDFTDGTSKSSASDTSAGTDSSANGNGTTALPTTEKDSAQPSLADEAGVAKLPEDRPATSDTITAAASTAAASSTIGKDASSKDNAGEFLSSWTFLLEVLFFVTLHYVSLYACWAFEWRYIKFMDLFSFAWPFIDNVFGWRLFDP